MKTPKGYVSKFVEDRRRAPSPPPEKPPQVAHPGRRRRGSHLALLEPQEAEGVYVEGRVRWTPILSGIVAIAVAALVRAGFLDASMAEAVQSHALELALGLIGAVQLVTGIVRARAVRSSTIVGDDTPAARALLRRTDPPRGQEAGG